ncbi:PaaI family thioesterase [Tumebacillus flagellatus]|uniref:Phenylacetate degradation protein n=1 Tax=Tumebacillus flagellatus TaxID=1157490 RepID=A0A074LIV1_9BACL|nr:hotdog fold thioesterase [Tumebacillus flagellatus]KEO81054.1 phenylacetate degradation protein [Tumebacillus flagellatus]
MAKYPDDLEMHRKHYEEIAEKLKQDTFAQFLGIQLVEVGPGTATAEMVVTENMLNAHGTTHGGVIFSLADFVFAVACNSYGKTSVGLNVNTGFLAASRAGDTLRATAVEEKKNNRTAWYRIRVEANGELIANADCLAYRKSDYFVPVE